MIVFNVKVLSVFVGSVLFNSTQIQGPCAPHPSFTPCLLQTHTGISRVHVWSYVHFCTCMGFPGGSDGKESSCNAGDLGSVLGLGRSPGEGIGCPPQYPGLENAMVCIVHRVAKRPDRSWNPSARHSLIHSFVHLANIISEHLLHANHSVKRVNPFHMLT